MLTYLFLICLISIQHVILTPVPLGPPDFNRTLNISITSQESNSSYIEIPHGLEGYPFLVEVCVFATAKYKERACYPAQGNINFATDTPKYGSVVYYYNKDVIRLWILAESNESNASLYEKEGWGRQPSQLEVKQSAVEVRAWKSGPIPDYMTSLYLDGCDTYKIIEHGLDEISFLSFELEITEGANKGFRLNPCGSAHVNATTAGIVCLYSNRAVRVFTQSSGGLLALVPLISGTEERQNVTHGVLRVRVWSVSWPVPCFSSPWENILQNDTMLQYRHDVGSEGKVFSVQVNINDGANSGYIMSSFSGMRTADLTGLIYFYNSGNITILLATPGGSENNVFTLTDAWGSGINQQNSNSLQIRVVVWYADAGVCPNGGMDYIEMPAGYTERCTQCSFHSVCDSDNNCSCDAGFYGDYCETTCEINTEYNSDCASTCNCDSQHLCNPITGECFPIISHITSMLLLSPHFESELFPAGKIQRMENVIALLQRDTSISDLNSQTIDQTTLYTLHNGVSYQANVTVQIIQIKAEGDEGLIQFVIYNNTHPLASIESVGILNRVNRSVLSMLLGFSVQNISSTPILQLTTSYSAISHGELWKVLSSVSVLTVEILFVSLLLLCIALSECIRSQAKAEKEDSLYSSHKSSKKSSSKSKPKSQQNRKSPHISFNNPYYDVIAAMDLAGDIDQDFHNPLFIQQ